MREIFPSNPAQPPDPGRVYYTIRQEDVGKTLIATEIATINVSEFMTRVRGHDVGKRIIRTPNNAGDYWFWQLESQEQFETRMARKARRHNKRRANHEPRPHCRAHLEFRSDCAECERENT